MTEFHKTIPFETYATRLNDLVQKVEGRFGPAISTEVVNIVRAASRANNESGDATIAQINKLLDTPELDEVAFVSSLKEIVQDQVDKPEPDGFSTFYAENSGVNSQARKFIEEVVPTLKKSELGEKEGREYVEYADAKDFILALQALKPTRTMSFSGDTFFLGMNQQLGFLDANGTLHLMNVNYKKSAEHKKKILPAFKALDELGIKDGDGFFKISDLGDLYIQHRTDAPDEQDRRETVVREWQDEVKQVLAGVEESKKGDVKFNYYTDGNGSFVDVTVGKNHYVTAVLEGDAISLQDVVKDLPDWVKKQSMMQAHDWLSIMNVVK